MRIGIVHVGWPLQALIRDLTNGLAAQGHVVSLVATAEDDRGFVGLHTFRGTVELVATPRSLGRIDRRARRWLGSVLPGTVALNAPWVRQRVGRALASWQRQDLLIGVEKAGLDLAAFWGDRLRTRFVYYSLELYLEDHHGLAQFAWQRPSERAAHRGASGTIVQDKLRWEALRAANGVADQRVFFLPVGINATDLGIEPLTESSSEPARQPFTLLSLGMQGPGRYTRELVEAAARLPAGMSILLHGPVYDAATRRLAEGTLPPNLRFTTNMLPESELPPVLASADVGLALYRCDCANDRLTAYSSQKIASYLQAGLPIIAFRNDAYADLLARFRCGELVDDLAQLGAAAQRIRDAYAAYRAAARAAFEGIYRLDRYWPELSAFLSACSAP
jgi:glycosyltransferase involved in cell wall biosynthesis